MAGSSRGLVVVSAVGAEVARLCARDILGLGTLRLSCREGTSIGGSVSAIEMLPGMILAVVDASASIKSPRASSFGMIGIAAGASTIGTGGGFATSSAASPRAARRPFIFC